MCPATRFPLEGEPDICLIRLTDRTVQSDEADTGAAETRAHMNTWRRHSQQMVAPAGQHARRRTDVGNFDLRELVRR